MMMILMEMITTQPNAAAAPTIAPALLLSGDVLSEGGVVLSEEVANTMGK